MVIGVGNEFRRDDGAGPAVVAKLRDPAPPGVELVTIDGEPTRLIEAWTGAALAVVVDERSTRLPSSASMPAASASMLGEANNGPFAPAAMIASRPSTASQPGGATLTSSATPRPPG